MGRLLRWITAWVDWAPPPRLSFSLSLFSLFSSPDTFSDLRRCRLASLPVVAVGPPSSGADVGRDELRVLLSPFCLRWANEDNEILLSSFCCCCDDRLLFEESRAVAVLLLLVGAALLVGAVASSSLNLEPPSTFNRHEGLRSAMVEG